MRWASAPGVTTLQQGLGATGSARTVGLVPSLPEKPMTRIAGIFTLVVGAVSTYLLLAGLFPSDLAQPSDPTVADIVFLNRGVIWVSRLLLVSAAVVLAMGGVFIAVSIRRELQRADTQLDRDFRRPT